MFLTSTECIEWIETIERFEPRTDLSRMNLALAILDHPEKDLKIIHVAGTDGKGSTVSYIKNILIEDNFTVGTFVSPYVVCFNERIQYNYSYISDSDLILYTNTILKVYDILKDEYSLHLTFFEVLTLIGICYFKAKEVNYVILEVGLGGKLDATNFCCAEVSLITNIGWDHMKQLGNTLEEIALNKLGIVKKGNHLITTVDESLLPLFEKYVNEVGATMEYINPKSIVLYKTEQASFSLDGEDFEVSMIGFHQAYNASLAIKAVQYLEPDTKLKTIRNGLLNTTWPGRCEIVSRNPKVILDGGHNIHGLSALCETITAFYKDPIIVFACMRDKETEKMVNLLNDVASTLIITSIDYHRAIDADSLYMEVKSEKKILEPNYIEAIHKGIALGKEQKKTVIITGSLYFIARARAFLLENK